MAAGQDRLAPRSIRELRYVGRGLSQLVDEFVGRIRCHRSQGLLPIVRVMGRWAGHRQSNAGCISGYEP